MKISDIKINNRHRELDNDKVNELAESIKENGLINPVTINAENELIAGLHRLEACKKNDLNEIPVNIIRVKGLKKELVELDENLMRNDLHYIERGKHLSRRKEIYEQLYPETKQTTGKKLVEKRWNKQDKQKNTTATDAPAFTKDAAQKTGASERTIQQDIQISNNLIPKALKIVKEKDISKREALQLAQLKPEKQEKIIEQLKSDNTTLNQAFNKIKQKEKQEQIKQEQQHRTTVEPKHNAHIYNEPAENFLKRFGDKSIDLLLTDPPYSTDIDNLSDFLDTWLLNSLNKIKDTGRAFICIGAYPQEIHTYLNILLKTDWTVDCPLIWTYKNTLGQTPNMKYNLNYQIILHLYKETSNPLNNNITNEMFSVQEINAPDGRIGDRWFKWQKPDKLAQQIIHHSTKEEDTIIDPFAGSGTFLLQANEYNRIAYGSEYDESVYDIALKRGCHEE